MHEYQRSTENNPLFPVGCGGHLETRRECGTTDLCRLRDVCELDVRWIFKLNRLHTNPTPSTGKTGIFFLRENIKELYTHTPNPKQWRALAGGL